jgi:hypothetical protein
VAILSTPPMGEETALLLQPIDSATPVRPSAVIRHLPDSVVRGAVVPQAAAVVAIAATVPKVDPSWGSALLLVAPDREPVPLLENVYQGTRPLVLPDGRVYVLAGVEGAEPTEEQAAAGRLRVDSLDIYEVSLEVGNRRSIFHTEGYIAFLAGALGGEIFVYHVAPGQAQLLAIDVDKPTYPQRVLARPIPPYARDFSVDVQSRSLIFTNRDEANASEWSAQKLDLTRPPAPAPPPAPGVRVLPRSLVKVDRSSSPEIRAYAWPGQDLAVSKNRAGLEVKGARALAGVAGVVVLRDFFMRDSQTWAIALQRQPGELATVVTMRADANVPPTQARSVPTPAGTQIDVAGVLLPAAAEIQRAPAIMRERPVLKRADWVRPEDLRRMPTPALRGIR